MVYLVYSRTIIQIVSLKGSKGLGSILTRYILQSRRRLSILWPQVPN